MTVVGLLDLAERQRVQALAGVEAETQSELGQFFTPAAAAALIASIPRLPERGVVRVLDPGAGSGVLSAALVERVLAERPDLRLHVVAVECDRAVLAHLRATLDACVKAGQGRVRVEVVEADFIFASTGLDATMDGQQFDLVIENPPYGKLAVSSRHRRAMRGAGMDAPNLYAAFLALSAAALADGGQLVAITPRSFFNGPYFGPFRRHLLERISLDRVHVFESRSSVFCDTGVLQENVIFSGTRSGARNTVVLSVSRDHTDQVVTREVPYDEVVHPGDPHQFIRLSTDAKDTVCAETMLALPCSLADLGIEVSTGRVVDFRARHALRHTQSPDGAPLVYPGNLHDGGVQWPRDIRKPQWFVPASPHDEALLLPSGWYTVVKRFSTKEERRRIVASTWSPLENPAKVAFENHLNVFHAGGAGLDEPLARGLTLWLNSSLVDRFFRTFSGHTQVNATDLRTLRFPAPSTLRDLGRHTTTEQQHVDALVLERIAA
ncbi:MAG: class I SAM-dependent methyltransferase [Micrococcales bacterium]|nr:class I SAM-dependent methyltransferase [Micrococcales bacterium]